jgi:PAS domain S-box-containing protein/putative nucleotidyltransferase with HDIG domain
LEPSVRPFKILIIEDNPDDAHLLMRELRSYGYSVLYRQVETAETMQKALDDEQWDMVIADYSMPKFSVPAALNIIHDRKLDLPFIVVSGSVGEEVAVAALKAGAHDFVIKGKWARLRPAIERELREVEVRRARRQAELALRESEERYRRVSELISDFAYSLSATPDGELVVDWITEALNRISGLQVKQGEYFTQVIQTIVLPDDVVKLTEHQQRLLNNEASMVEFRIRAKNGEVLWLRDYAQPVWAEDQGRVTRFYGAVQDVTHQKTAEAALKESEEKYRTIFETTSAASVILDENLNILLVNTSFEQMFGFEKSEVENKKSWRAFVADEEWERVYEYHVIRMEEEGRAPTNYEMQFIRRSGDRLDALVTVALLPGTRYSVVSMLDITDRKMNERVVKRRAEELQVLHAVASQGAEVYREIDLIEYTTGVMGSAFKADRYGFLIYQPNRKKMLYHPSYVGLRDEEREKAVELPREYQRWIEGLQYRVEPSYGEPSDGMGSLLRAPLLIGDNLIGMIQIESVQTRIYKEDDRRLMMTLAGQLSTAITRLRAEASRRKRAWQMEILYRVSQEIASASLSPEAVYSAIHHAAGALMPAEAFVISLYDAVSDEIDAVYMIDRNNRVENRRIPAGKGISSKVITMGEPILITDFNEEVEQALGVEHFGSSEMVRSILAVPLRRGNKVTGMLSAQSYQPNAYTNDDVTLLNLLSSHAAIALENANLFTEVHRQALTFESIFDAVLLTDEEGIILDVNPAARRLFGYEHEDMIGQPTSLINPADQNGELHRGIWEYLQSNNEWRGEIEIIRKDGTHGISEAVIVPLRDNDGVMIASISVNRDITERKQSEVALRRYTDQMAAISALGQQLTETLDLPEIYQRLANSVKQLLPDIATVIISLFDPVMQSIICAYAVVDDEEIDVSQLPVWPLALDGSGSQSKVILSRKPLIVNDVNKSSKKLVRIGSTDGMTQCALYIPLISKNEVIGVLQAQSYLPDCFTDEDTNILTLFGNSAAIAIDNARLFAETRQRLERLSALREIDITVRSGADLKVILSVLLDQVISSLQADAASVLRYHPEGQSLEFEAGQGFQKSHVVNMQFRLGEGFTGKTAQQRKTLVYTCEDLDESQADARRLFTDEEFVTYVGTPLIAKSQVQGVLETYFRRPFTPEPEWINYFETLAGDLAIAMDNITLFTELQRSNMDLVQAYDTTLEGWAHALELRDQETKGHCVRVAELTLQLAGMMGVSGDDLVHIRRGALLHDIGKMAIPDSILHKPGALNEDEWRVMRRHPMYSYEMLAPVKYLEPALTIPHYHHERWDGSGYPEGLSGEEIPLPARIFAVVDVWDALTSDRPYRPAWSKAKTTDYLKREAGRLLDPDVVENFLVLLKNEHIIFQET